MGGGPARLRAPARSTHGFSPKSAATASRGLRGFWPTRLREEGLSRAPGIDRAQQGGNGTAESSQVVPRHTGESTYRCFLPDLAGFGSHLLRGSRLSAPAASPRPLPSPCLKPGIRPRISGFRVQGTASSPSSTAKLFLFGALPSKPSWRRERDLNPRGGFEAAYTISNRAPSAARTSLRRQTC